jgi:hypothetical protein
MVFFFHHNQLFIIKDKMKHILNNLSEEEKNAIREQHAGGMKVITENFSKLLNSKLGDVKPLVNEQQVPQPPRPGVARPTPSTTAPQAGGLNYKVLADTLDKSMRGMGTNLPLLQSVINKIKTPQDWQKLNAAFGTRDGQDLDTWFRRDIIAAPDWKKIIQPLYVRVGLEDSEDAVGGASR